MSTTVGSLSDPKAFSQTFPIPPDRKSEPSPHAAKRSKRMKPRDAEPLTPLRSVRGSASILGFLSGASNLIWRGALILRRLENRLELWSNLLEHVQNRRVEVAGRILHDDLYRGRVWKCRLV